MPPRNGLREQFRGYPAVGAVHPIASTKQVRECLLGIADIADDVFDPQDGTDLRSIAEKQADGDLYDSTKFYRLFDAQTLGLSVFEADIPKRVAERARVVWEKKDLGVLRQEVIQESQRFMPNEHPKLKVSGVIPVGGRLPMAPKEQVRSKLAFSFDPSEYSQTMDLLFRENEIVANAIASRLRKKGRKDSPADLLSYDFLPHVTFMAYKQRVDVSKIAEANGEVDEYVKSLNLVLPLLPLTTERTRLTR